MIDDPFSRIAADLVARVSGPMKFRLDGELVAALQRAEDPECQGEPAFGSSMPVRFCQLRPA